MDILTDIDWGGLYLAFLAIIGVWMATWPIFVIVLIVPVLLILGPVFAIDRAAEEFRATHEINDGVEFIDESLYYW